MREVPEWVGASDDTPAPPRVRLRVFEKFEGRCAMCRRLLRPGHWALDHKVALVNGGGGNRETNLQPLCTSPCHSGKTREDVAEKSRTRRHRQRNAGIRKRRTITQWRRFDGTIVKATRER